MCLTLIFDIASFIIESKSFHKKNGDSRKLQYFLRLSTKYLEIAFPLGLRQLSEDMIYLRGTEHSKHLLEEIISRKVINSRNELTYRQIGEVMMIMLGSGKPKHKLRDMITARLSENSYWKPFIENLIATMESDSRRDFELVSGFLHKALIETYNINWRTTDYISPNCFFYPVERLLIMVPHSRGFFFATKSSFVEYLTCLQPDANPSAGLVFDTKSYPMSIFDFVIVVIRECLYNSQSTAEWIVRSCINCDYYFPLLMVRLFVLLCLSCLNSELSFGILFEMMRLPQVRNHLPKEFCQVINRIRKNDISDEAAVARAFEAIGDPLVIVASTENRLEISCPDAVFLDLSSFSCRNDAMNKLFPKSTEASSYQQVTTTTVEERNVVSEEVTSAINAQSSETVSETDLRSSSEHDKANLQINWGLVREMRDGLELLRNRNDGDLKSLILRKKEEMEEHISVLTAEVAVLSEDENTVSEARSMIEELNELCSLLDTCDSSNTNSMSEIGEVLKGLLERRPGLEGRLSNLNNPPNAGVVVEAMDDEKTCSTTSVAATGEDGNSGRNHGKWKDKKKNKRKKMGGKEVEESGGGNFHGFERRN